MCEHGKGESATETKANEVDALLGGVGEAFLLNYLRQYFPQFGAGEIESLVPGCVAMPGQVDGENGVLCQCGVFGQKGIVGTAFAIAMEAYGQAATFSPAMVGQGGLLKCDG